MSMDPEVDMSPEFNSRLDKIVEEMRSLNISSIRIIQDSVVVGMGDSVTEIPEFPGKVG